MFKKLISVILALCTVAALCSCSAGTSETNTTSAATAETTAAETATTKSEISNADSPETLEDKIIEETEKAIATLTGEYEELSAGITSYDEYVANSEKVEEFYDKVNSTSEQIAINLCEYSGIYGELIMNSDMTTDDMYDAFDDLCDCVYKDAADILYDGIYDGLLEDIYDDFYDGILDDRDDSISYSDWYDTRSTEYKLWYRTRSDCYEHWSDMRSDVYEFCSDMRSELFSNDIEKAQKILEDFKEDVQKMSE